MGLIRSQEHEVVSSRVQPREKCAAWALLSFEFEFVGVQS